MAATACESPYYASSAIPTRLGSNIRRSSLIFQPPRTPAGNDDSFYFHMRKRLDDTGFCAGSESGSTGKYTILSGRGFDTPTLATAVHFDINDAQRDINFRSKWDTTSLSTPEQSYVSGPLARERNGKSRLGNNSSTAGWGTFVFSLVSGAAGRMWDLCLSTAPFLGFYAGGGEGYAFPSSSQSPASNDLDASYFRLPTPMSGKYPPVSETSSQRASKHFPFLSLPVELRIRIYNSLPRRQRFRRSDRDYVYRGQVFDPTVLRVCSDVYKEALPELYRLATLSLRADYFQNYLRPSYGKDPGPPFWPAVTITGDVAAGGNGPERALDGEGRKVSWPQSRVDRFVEALRLAPQLQSLTLRTTDNMWLRKGDKHVLYALEVLRQIRNAGPFELKIVVREQGAEDSVFALKECGFCVVWEKGGEEVEVEHEGGEADEGNADAGPEEGEEDEVLTYWGANTRCAALRV
ncbi:hypothetical protein H2203_007690 [Taxawa tesnikishii (nom. ined.)]|nr:hypothetical protein H2203_007690 [Dothideales sp. JES 119]